ncbi:MAG: DnaJ domain-containing protein [Candidatus Microbacterium phytovorans]|uniref:DnaJ domain-containing protein n=1 Tax=Candidatus Microbacterium phytovorans TaxID=3121374 RepID=A0AAJ5W1H6_9MICO|nr:DnaJ domain-containing protein [Microbacterium sp.]WEK13885.1 MAG: DnaJ domain-containing protein [Microbacterium sp.]
MTLDEARTCLGLDRDASTSDIHRAFRARAREVHPDRHPGAHDADRARLASEFDRARAARDALLSWAALAPASPGGASGAASGREAARGPEDASHRASSASSPADAPSHPEKAPTDPPPRRRARPRTSETRRPEAAPRVTMRFEEFVAFTDAAGFGIGRRSRRWIDWPRVIAWSSVGVLAAAIAVAAAFTALL